MRVLVHTGIGSGTWGLGHGVRMLALAKALTAQGADVSFLTPTTALAAFVAPFPCSQSLYVWPQWDVDVLVEDVPAPAPPSWYHHVRQRSRVVRVDVPCAQASTCDLLVGPGAHWDPATVADLRTALGERLLVGWEHVLLDPAVTALPRVPYAARVDGPVVLCAGGSDPTQVLPQMAAALGGQVQTQDWVALVPQYGTPVALPAWVRPVPFDRDWVRRASLVVTTWGVTCYEAVYWGTPVIALALTPATQADAHRLALSAGGALRSAGSIARAQTLIKTLAAAPQTRGCMAQASAGVLDGQGAVRVAHAILALQRLNP